MNDIIDKTKSLIDSFENSSLIRNLEHYKFMILNNNRLLELITRYNNSKDDYEKLSIKEQIYKYEEYKEYMKYYNELFYYILKINNIYKKFTDVRGCNNESN